MCSVNEGVGTRAAAYAQTDAAKDWGAAKPQCGQVARQGASRRKPPEGRGGEFKRRRAAPAPVAAGVQEVAGAGVHLAGHGRRSTRAADRKVAASPAARSRRVEKGIRRSRNRRAARRASPRAKSHGVDRRSDRGRLGSRRRREAARGPSAKPRAAPALKPARPAATRPRIEGGRRGWFWWAGRT